MPTPWYVRPGLMRKLLQVWVLVALAGSGSAFAACEPPPVPDQPTASQISAAVDILLQGLAQCQKSAPWLATLGHYLNRQGRYADAADHLERALMLAPELQSAQLDYALSLAGLGDTGAASALVRDLLATPGLPEHLRPILQQQVAQWAAPRAVTQGWQSRGSISTRLGWDSNLLGSPNLDTLTLTVLGQNVVLPLDESYRPVPGGYVRADAQMHFQRTDPDGVQWQAQAALRTRRSPGLALADSSQLDAQLERSNYQLSPGSVGQRSGSYTGVSVSVLDAQAGTHYQALGLAAGWGQDISVQGSAPACQTRVGLELQERRYTSNPLLSGRYSGLAAAWSCAPLGRAQWLLALKTGLDSASTLERAGGDQRQTTLRVAGFMPQAVGADGGRSYWVADVELSLAQDRSPYSALLESGSPRTLQRTTVRLEHQRSVGATWQWVLGAEWTAQQSNLPLFTSQSWGPYTTLRWGWQ